MKSAIQQWGNSLAVRIPRLLAHESRVERGSPIEIAVADGNLIIAPLRKKSAVPLRTLLKKIKKSNLHREIEIGRRAGKEIW
jgi:antitoxin MazE